MNADQIQKWRRKRLDVLVDNFGGRAKLGRSIGYKTGAYVRQMIDGERAITEKTIAKLENLRGYEGWFTSDRVTDEMKSDLQHKCHELDITKSDVMIEIATRLKMARDMRGLTQCALAVAAGVTQGAIGNIESGTRRGLQSLPALAKALRVSHDWLAYGEGDKAFEKNSLGERLHTAMLATQKTDRRSLAKAIGISVQAIGMVINGETKSLTAENCSKAANYLGVRTDWLAANKGSVFDETTNCSEIRDNGSYQSAASHRRKRLRYLIETKFQGSRSALVSASGLTKGRVAQLLSGNDAFGERAAKSLAEKLGLAEHYFDLQFDNQTSKSAHEEDTRKAINQIEIKLRCLDDAKREEVASIFVIFAKKLRPTTKEDLIAALDQPD